MLWRYDDAARCVCQLGRDCWISDQVQQLVIRRHRLDPDLQANIFTLLCIPVQKMPHNFTLKLHAVPAWSGKISNLPLQKSRAISLRNEVDGAYRHIVLQQHRFDRPIRHGVPLIIQQPGLHDDRITTVIRSAIGSHANKIGTCGQAFADRPANDLAPELMMQSIADTVPQTP